jgi:hypothetical protein
MSMKPKAPKPMGQKKKVVVLKNPVEKKIEGGLKFLFGDKSTATGKKKPGATKVKPNRRGLPKDKPVQILPKYGNTPSLRTPIPSGPRNPNRTRVKQTPVGPKVKSPSTATPKAKKPSPSGKTNYGPLPKNPTLNDYLMRGIRPPSRNKPGSRPSDADVIIKGYNDPATIKKYKKK